jgi:hypothetical protein
MKVNELRIGNLYNQFGNIHQVNGHIISELEKAPQGQLWCKPIPLTEEWLIKFGKIDWISKDINGIFFWFNGEKKYIKFVHSLQNTYYCIEQKELI